MKKHFYDCHTWFVFAAILLAAFVSCRPEYGSGELAGTYVHYFKWVDGERYDTLEIGKEPASGDHSYRVTIRSRIVYTATDLPRESKRKKVSTLFSYNPVLRILEPAQMRLAPIRFDAARQMLLMDTAHYVHLDP